jgi:hypothetical protein
MEGLRFRWFSGFSHFRHVVRQSARGSRNAFHPRLVIYDKATIGSLTTNCPRKYKCNHNKRRHRAVANPNTMRDLDLSFRAQLRHLICGIFQIPGQVFKGGKHMLLAALTRYLILACFLVGVIPTAFGQRLHLGVKGGVPVTEYFQTGIFPGFRSTTQFSSATRRYTVGVFAECRIYGGFGLEADVQYKRMGYVHDLVSHSYSGTPNTEFYDVKGSSWDFPILATYRFGQSRRPFVSGGGTFRHLGSVRARGMSKVSIFNLPAWQTVTTIIDTNDPYELEERNFSGLTIGGGFEFGRGWLRFAPELRYTHWISNIGTVRNALQFNPNQLEFLLGLSYFRSR